MAEIKDPENTIIMETTKGRVVIELRPDVAPGHVARIKELTREGAYDGVVFHRVIEDFMAQTGDVQYGKTGGEQFNPSRAGMGGSSKPDLKAEFSDVSHVRGTCSMARSQCRTRPIPSSSSASPMLPGSTSSILSGARSSKDGEYRQHQARRTGPRSGYHRFDAGCRRRLIWATACFLGSSPIQGRNMQRFEVLRPLRVLSDARRCSALTCPPRSREPPGRVCF